MSEYIDFMDMSGYEGPALPYEIIEDAEPAYNNHYIRADERGRVVDGWSDGPRPDESIDGAILLNDKGGYQFRLWPDGEENPPLLTDDGIPLYERDGLSVRARPPEDVEADRAAQASPTQTPTQEQRLAAMEAAILEMAGEVYG